MRLAIIITHPIQYYAPLFQMLSERGKIQIKVFYTWGDKGVNKYDPGFKKNVNWDIPLIEGYNYTFVKNISLCPGSHRFWGIINLFLIREIKNWSPNAILMFGWNFFSHLLTLIYFKDKIPILFRGDSTLIDEHPGLRRLARRKGLSIVYKYIDIALYVGSENRKYFTIHGLTDKQTIFAPHAIQNERFTDDLFKNYAHKAHEFRKNLGIPENSIVIEFAGKFENKKNIFLLFEAAKLIKNINNNLVYFLFVGNGILEHKLKLASQKYSHIRFLDFQNQSLMPIVYRIGDIFCLPSKGPGETWGLSVNEAMACGMPILVSDCCGCAQDLVKPGLNGYIFRSNDLEDLIGKIYLICQSNLNKMGEESKKIINNWTIEKQCQTIESVLLDK